MKKQFAKFAALAVMVLGMVSAQASAAGVSVNFNLSNGRVNVALSDDCCHHVVHKKAVKKKGSKRHHVKEDKHHARACHHVASRRGNRRSHR